MAPKILCTGGAGYIGIHTAVHLERAGYECVILDNLSNACFEAVRRLREIVGREVAFAEIDCCDLAALDALFEKEKFDGVIHYAAFKAVGESVAKPLEYYSNNLFGTINLLKCMVKHKVHKLVFSSSATVYKIAKTQTPLKEDDELCGYNPYGQTKLMSEQIIRDTCVAHPEMKASLLRYFNPVGAHPSGRIGESPENPLNILPYIQKVAIGRKACLSVFGNDWETKDGTGVRDYIHVEDIGEGHIAALAKMDATTGGCCDTYNLGTGEGNSVLELVSEFEKATGTKIAYQFTARRPGDIAYAVANPSRANAELKWKATRSIGESCASAHKWQKGNPAGYEESKS